MNIKNALRSHLSSVELSETEYVLARQDYQIAINGVIYDYLTAPGERYDYARDRMKRIMVAAFILAFLMEYANATREDLDWLEARYVTEIGYITLLFENLRTLKQTITPEDAATEARNRALGYTRTLDGIYSQGRLRANPDVMLIFDGTDGSPTHICQKTGGTCVRLKGQRHRARWWVERDLVPYPGNANYDCGCYECQHFLRDAAGRRWTFRE